MSSGHFSRRSYQVDLLALQYHLRRWGMLLAVIQVVLRTFDLFLKVIPEGVVEGRKLEATTKTWKLDRSTRALTAPMPAKASKTLSVYEPSFFTSACQPPLCVHWQDDDSGHITGSSLAKTCILDCVLQHTFLSSYPRFHNRPVTAPSLGCYSYVYALSDEARKQQCVSFASIIISTIAVGHMVWLYRQRRGTR